MGTFLGISGIGLLIAFVIHAIYGSTLPAGWSDPYPIIVQIAVGVFALGAPIVALPISIFSDAQRG